MTSSPSTAQRQAFRRELPPVAAPGPLFAALTSVSAVGARLAGALVHRSTRRASHLLLLRRISRRPHHRRPGRRRWI